MKHFLRLMGQLCPLSNLYKTKLTAIVAVMALFMCLIAAIQAPAQTGAAATMDEIQPLQIGDKIPEELWHMPLQVVNHPEGKETITLNDYRGKLIILDFWATWCGSCLKKFPDIEKYNSIYADSAIVLLVNSTTTRDRIEMINETLADKESTLMSIVDDEILKGSFPVGILPYQIWIDDRRNIRSISFGEYLTSKNIELAIQRINVLKAKRESWKRN